MKRHKKLKLVLGLFFNLKKLTLIAAQIELVYNDLIDQSLKIDGISIPGI
jgi:hypothetical protein